MRFPPVQELPLKDRASFVYLKFGDLDVVDGAFVLVDATGVRTQIPIGAVACVFLEPGTRLSHAAAVLAARVGTLIVWAGEAGVRMYSAGQPGGARCDRLLRQARLALNKESREAVARAMFRRRFGYPPPKRCTIEQLRGLEGHRVKAKYAEIAVATGVEWTGRNFSKANWGSADRPNRCLSAATACLYGVTEAAVLVAGYSPSIGFLHGGKPLSFVYDIADLFKFETVVPIAFEVAATEVEEPEAVVRRLCRDCFRRVRLLDQLIPTIEETLDAGDRTPAGEAQLGGEHP
jgi:CRISPR-associated protein Cas1